ncbi:HNH endonuclease family protein [Kineococcus sp. G2]|uniref:HNH endonuclease family protein n=1 Tax=Kineococcus sp. G2 TaxID=3127484 RepID=UPI00301D51A8
MPARRSGALAAILAPLVLLLLAVALWRALAPGTGPQERPAATGSAARALAALEVREEASSAGYQRTRFGESWVDVDGNGCRTRDDVLQRDLVDVRLADDGCTVLSGTLVDPYSGEEIAFRRGERTSAEVQVDHVVALADAWRTGAQKLSAQERVAFANDPLELLAVDGSLNQSKGDDDAAQWLPPVGECEYVARQVAVKSAWGLWVTPAERDAMADVLAGCPGQELPAS